jgi:hypothetical protein
MERMYIYQMRSLEAALMAAQALDRESKDLLVGMGIMLLIRPDDSEDWYAFGNLENPTNEEAARVVSILSQCGVSTNYSFEQIFHHERRIFAGSGNFAQILFSIQALGKSDDKLRPEIARTVSLFKADAASTNN